MTAVVSVSVNFRDLEDRVFARWDARFQPDGGPQTVSAVLSPP